MDAEIIPLLSTFAMIARTTLGLSFLWAGLAKVKQRTQFAEIIGEYRIVSANLGHQLARVLPGIEVTLGIMLLIGIVTRLAVIAVLILIAGFTTAVSFSLYHRRSIPCLCFGNPRERIGWWTLYRNSGLVLLALTVLLTPTVPLSFDSIISGTHSWDLSGRESIVGAVISLSAIGVWVMTGEGVKYLRS